MMIISEAQRLQSEGKSGLQILPGVSELLNTVRARVFRKMLPLTDLSQLDAAPTSIWAIVTSGLSLLVKARFLY